MIKLAVTLSLRCMFTKMSRLPVAVDTPFLLIRISRFATLLSTNTLSPRKQPTYSLAKRNFSNAAKDE